MAVLLRMSAMKLYLLLFCSLPFFSVGQAVELEYARFVLDELCKPAYAGRAYVKDGERKAATFLAEEFRQAGLQSLTDESFQQHYFVNSNTFPSKVVVKQKGKLTPGIDFLIDAKSKGVNGKFDCKHLPYEVLADPGQLADFLSQNQGKILVIDESEFISDDGEKMKFLEAALLELQCADHPLMAIAGIIVLTENKLTWGPSPIQCKRLLLYIKKQKFYSDTKSIKLNIKNEFLTKVRSQNVIGFIEGKEHPDSLIVITGHYDHLGTMGKKAYFPGANDNASGIAMLLSLARHFAQAKNQPDKSMLFICFGSEEIGLLGSKYYTEHPLLPLSNINFLINLDILGTGDDGIMVVNGTIHKQEFQKIKELNREQDYLKDVKVRGEMCKTDHCYFHEKGVPSFYIYTLGGVAHYHDVFDKASTLPLNEFTDLKRLLINFIQDQDATITTR